MQIHWIANCVVPPPRSLSGGDRIMVECLRRWSKEHEITVYGWEGTRQLFDEQSVTGLRHVIWPSRSFEKWGFSALFAAQTWKGWSWAGKNRLDGHPPVLVSSSDFPPDNLPALRLKRRFPHLFWAAAFYLFAPSLIQHWRGGSTPGLKFCAYQPLQKWILRRILREADMILVTGEEDRERMIALGRHPDEVFAVRGGVDLSVPAQAPEPPQKEYEAVFIGRLHPQKGVRELIGVWKTVVQKIGTARLAIIGTGPMEKELKTRIRSSGLESHVVFHGFKDGVEKYRVIKSSRLVLHPAIYDSGGMAAAEALVCGLPGVAFDLPALRTYYPRGFEKVPPGDLKAFAAAVVNLLNDSAKYCRLSQEAASLSVEWDWNGRAAQIWEAMARQIQAHESRRRE
ncbi:MAG: glycosyltransferase [Verrucomicrobiae bacterium]|nr:glycosyltransferase [Verrucomicrobiae bacterium]